MIFYEMINSDDMILVEYYTTWNPHCWAMMPLTEDLKKTPEVSAIQ